MWEESVCLGPGSMPTWRCLSCCWPVDFLRNLFTQTLGLGSQKERLLDELTLEGVTRYMQSERCESPIAWPLLPFLAPVDSIFWGVGVVRKPAVYTCNPKL
jgi:hypothetical protein